MVRRLRRQWLCLLLSGVALLVGARALAIDSTQTLSELHHTQWTVREGAPAQIGALTQGSDGFIWIGAANGLYRFDGERFTRFTLADGSQPITGNVSALHALPGGELWVGMRFGGAYRIGEHSFTHYGEDAGLPRRSIIQFAGRGDGSMWAQTPGGLYRFEQTRWSKVGRDWQYPASVGYSVLLDSRGTLWSRGADGTFYLPPGATAFQKSTLNGGQGWLANCVDDSVWVSDFESGLHPVNEPGKAVSGIALSGGEAGTGAILCDRDGGLWTVVYTKDVSRLIRLPDAKTALTTATTVGVQELRAGEKLSGEQPGRFLEDREGNVWLSTLGGLDRFRSNKLHSAMEPTPLARAAMALDARGNMWFANNTSVVSFGSDGSAPHVQPFTGDATHWLSSFTVDADGSLLIAQQGQQLSRHAGGRIQAVSVPERTKLTTVQAVARDRSGALWVSISGDAAYRLDNGGWVVNGGMAELPHAVPVILRQDRRGRLWFGYADNRIAVVDRDQVELFDASNGLNVGAVLAIDPDGDHAWIAGADNVAVYSLNRFSSVTDSDGLPLSGQSGIVLGNAGDLWLNGTSGVVHIAAGQVQRFLKDPSHRVMTETFNYEDGLNGAAPQVRPLPTALKGGDGRIWFLTDLGVYWIDPSHIQRNPLPPTVKVLGVIAAGRTYANTATVSLPLHATNFEIHYTALSLAIPSRVRFRYKLEGVDSEWQDAGARRQAFYTNVPPGDHRFSVMAANEDGVWNAAGDFSTIYIPPALYQTKWFAVLCAAAAAALLWALYKLRVRTLAERMRSRLEERLTERERIARALHDILLQSMQGLIFRFQTITERLSSDEPARQLMEKELDRADAVLAEGRDQVAGLRGATLGSMDLAQILAAFADSLAKDHSSTFALTVEGQPQPLHPLVQEEAIRIGCEALSNAFRHAHAAQIEVELFFGRREWRLRIRDNGVGIDPNTLAAGSKPGHWGLIGMRERAAKIQASIDFWSRAGAGTEIALVVPAAVAYNEQKPGLWSRWFSAQRSLERR
ncbi:MAG: triple tyrosine motif-containing protein [Steroidobacteraceae bacterium]